MLEPLRGLPRRARPRRRRRSRSSRRRGPLQRHLRAAPRRRRRRPAPPAARPAAAQRPRRAARGARAAARSPAARACRAVLAVCDDDVGHRRAVLRHGARRGPRRHERGARPRSTPPTTAARIGEELVDALVEVHAVDWQRRRASRASASRPATSSASCAASSACGSTTSTREIPAVESVGDWLAEQPARVRPGDDRPRRLPPGQHDVRARRAGPAGRDLRLGDGDDRRPAGRPRLPVHAVGRPRRPAAAACSSCRRVTREEGFPPRDELDRALRGALGPLDDRHPLVPDARAVEVDRVHGGQLQARGRRRDRRPVPQGLRRGRDRARRARARRWPVAAERASAGCSSTGAAC